MSCVSTVSKTSKATIEALEKEWNESRIAGDAHRVASLLEDDWKLTHVDGRVEAKDSYVQGIASASRQIQKIEMQQRNVRILGNVAIVSGEVIQQGLRRGEVRAGRLRFTHVWVRHGSAWRMLLSQSTEVKSSE